MDPITLALIITLIINSALGFVVLSASSSTKTRLYAINVATILTWVASMVFYRFSSQENIVLWTKVLYVSASLIASSFLHFTYIFPSDDKKLTKKKLFAIFLANSILLLLTFFTSGIIENARVNETGENSIQFGPIYFLYVLYILFFFLYSFYRLYKRYRTTKDELEKRQTFYLFLGYSLSGNISFLTNLLLPWGGIFVLNWLGQISTILMVTFATYSILKHQLFSIKAVATELFVGALWSLLLIKLIISQDPQERIFDGVLLAVTIVVGIFLIKSVIREVQAREKIENLAKDLEVANERLKELDVQKSEFVSFATHQLRGPLTALKGYISLILEGDFGPISPEVKEVVDKLYKSSQSMVVLVGDYLDISRIELGRMKYDYSIFNLKELISSIISELKPTIEVSRLDFDFEASSNEVFVVNADQGKIKQVISNIIDNSIKYTPYKIGAGIKVKLVKNPATKKLLISISDTGVGIKKEVLPKLFEKFSRAPDASKTNILGTGLGLYVAKKMIEAHNGRIWAESEGEGKGSTFFIELAGS